MLDALTDKQREVLALVSEGMTSKEIARKLAISESAVNQRIEVIRQRLGGMPRSQIGRLYRRMSTVVITIPTSNSLTGKSIQLLADPLDGQHHAAEGAEVVLADNQIKVPFGSQPSALFSLLDSSGGIWFRGIATIAIAIGLLIIALLILTVFHTVSHLRIAK